MTAARTGGAFLLVWLPYVASTYLAERVGDTGIASQLLMLAAFVMIVPAMRLARNGFGLMLGRGALVSLLACFGLGLAAAVVRWRISIATGAALPGGGDGLVFSAGLAALAFAFIPSLTEDVLTRGFPLFRGQWRSLTAAILFSAALYTLNHLWRFDWGWTEQARLFSMGLAYAAAAVALRSLWAAVGLHLAGNVAPTLMASFAAGEVVERDTDRLIAAAAHLAIGALFLAVAARRRRRVPCGIIDTGKVKASNRCD